MFAATTKFNCAVNNTKFLPKIHRVGKQIIAVGYQRLREENSLRRREKKTERGRNT